MEQLRAEAWQEATRKISESSGPFSTFQTRYRHDPLGFVLDCIKWNGGGPAPYQREILSDLIEYKRVAVRGPHTLGKTALASWVVLWATLTEDDCKVPTTASAWRQLTKFLWPEVHKWAGRLRWDVIGRTPFRLDRELQTNNLKRGSSCEGFAVACSDPATIEGAHARRVVYIYDEAKGIPATTWDATEGAFAGAGADTDQEAFALAISTPGAPHGRFYDIHSRKPGYEDWHTRHVTMEEAIAAGRMSREWAEQRKRQWREGSAVYQNRVLGEFAAGGEDTVVSLADVERANELWHIWKEAGFAGKFKCVGVDVGRGGDPSMLALRFADIPPISRTENEREVVTELDGGIMDIRRIDVPNTMNVTGVIRGVLDKYGGYAVVDVIGIGAGVVDRLREMKKEARAFNAGKKTRRKDASGELGFVNARSAAWWAMRELLAEGRIALPPDEEIDPDGMVSLTGELTAPCWDRTSTGRIKIESKQELKKPDRLGHSTDAADAVIQAFWEERTGWSARY